MPDPVWYPTLAGLERKTGSAQVLTELSGAAAYGDATYTAFTDACLAVGRGYIRRAVEKKHAPETLDTLDAESAISLQRFATAKAAQTAWFDGGRGEAMPPTLVTELAEVDRELDLIGDGHRTIGRASGKSAALNQPCDVIDQDPTGAGYSMTGFRRGFR